MTATSLIAGYAADLACGDPHRLHPVAGFGTLAATTERLAYSSSKLRGTVLTAALVGASATAAELAARRGPRTRAALLGTTVWATIAGRSLRSEAMRIAALLEQDDLPRARHELRSLCGRDAAQLDADEIAAGVVESLAENSSDAVVGTLFWAAVAGPAGAVGYRAANTLDAMWGRRDDRYREFGFAAAKLDDLLNLAPARLTALLTAAAAPLVGGSPAAAVKAVRRDARAHPSPNAGVAEAAFAGALGLELGGPLSYSGHHEDRPRLGRGPRPAVTDIARAVRLSQAVCTLAALCCAALRRRRVDGRSGAAGSGRSRTRTQDPAHARAGSPPASSPPGGPLRCSVS